jgi:hypothetical protein
MKTLLIGNHTVIVDDEDFDRVSAINWSVRVRGKQTYFTSMTRRLTPYGPQTCQLLHRIVTDASPGSRVEFLGSYTDLQKHNLKVTPKGKRKQK